MKMDYTKMKKGEMKDMLKDRGVCFSKSAKRDDLIHKLVKSEKTRKGLTGTIFILLAIILVGLGILWKLLV